MLPRILAALALTVCVALPSFAQTDARGTRSPSTPVTAAPDRQTADRPTREQQAQRRAALKQKRADCRRQAKEQKIGFLRRGRFIRDCMKRS